MPDLSERGHTLIKSFEGLRLETYLDSVGVPTIGWGHTGTEAAAIGNRITRADADRLFANDVSRFTRGVLDMVQVAISQAQLDALISFAYNVGLGAFRNSRMLAFINRGDFDGAAGEFSRWVYGDTSKPPLPGLVRRRDIEASMFRGAESTGRAVRDAQQAHLSHVAAAHEAAERG